MFTTSKSKSKFKSKFNKRMNYYYLLVLCLLIALFIYCSIRVHHKYQTDYQILQISDPEKDVLEITLGQKYPTILTDVVMTWKGIRDLDPQMVKEKSNDLIKDAKFTKLLNQYLDFYHLPLTISRNYTLNHLNKNDTKYIVWQSEFRYYTVQVYGKASFILFSPDQAKYLYPTKDHKVSKINYWKLDKWDKDIEMLTQSGKSKEVKAIEKERTKYLEKYPKYNKAKFIEIILHPDNILYIPYNWWFTSIALDDNIRITATSRSLFSW